MGEGQGEGLSCYDSSRASTFETISKSPGYFPTFLRNFEGAVSMRSLPSLPQPSSPIRPRRTPCRCLWPCPVAALIAEPGPGSVGLTAFCADKLQLGAACVTELRSFTILRPATRAFHGSAPPPWRPRGRAHDQDCALDRICRIGSAFRKPSRRPGSDRPLATFRMVSAAAPHCSLASPERPASSNARPREAWACQSCLGLPTSLSRPIALPM